MHILGSVVQEPPASPHVASLDGRGSGDIASQRKNPTKAIRYLYYRLYTKDGAIESYNYIHSNDRSIGRILTKAVAPPHTVSSLKRYLCKIEGFPASGAENSVLYDTLSSQFAIMPDSTQISLLGHSGIGSSVDDPAVLVTGNENFEKRAGNTDVSKDLSETHTKDTRHVYYRVYDDMGEITSKTHFDKDDLSLGRVDVLSIAPPRTISSLMFRLLKAEDFLGDDVQLFEDMGSDSPMDDTDVLTFLGDDYPGSIEDQPMAIVHKKRAVITSPPKPTAFIKKIKANKTHSFGYYPNWLPISTGEVFFTDGIAIQHRGFPGDPHCFTGYMATNSAGREGFVANFASEFC